jgi:hypothetical protein
LVLFLCESLWKCAERSRRRGQVVAAQSDSTGRRRSPAEGLEIGADVETVNIAEGPRSRRVRGGQHRRAPLGRDTRRARYVTATPVRPWLR